MDVPYEALELARMNRMTTAIWTRRCQSRRCFIASRVEVGGNEYVLVRPFKISPGMEEKLAIQSIHRGRAWPASEAPEVFHAGCRHQIGTLTPAGWWNQLVPSPAAPPTA